MSNHYHVVIETVEGNLSAGMRQLNGVYTQHFNKTHQRVGHVFQGRYKAILVERDTYLLELARYVVLNPVRAKMVDDAKDWSWSSYLFIVGEKPVPDWLATEWMLAQFGENRKRCIAKYKDFVRAGVGLPPIWSGLSNQIFLGGEEFVSRMQAEIESQADLREIPRTQRRPKAKPLDFYQARHVDRRQAMASAFATGDYTLKEIADHFQVHYSTVSRAVKKAEELGNKSI